MLVIAAVFDRLVGASVAFGGASVAIALFAGATLADRRLAVVAPLLALLAAQFLKGYSFHGFLVICAALALVTCIGFALRRTRTALPIAAGLLVGSLVFNVVCGIVGKLIYEWGVGGETLTHELLGLAGYGIALF